MTWRRGAYTLTDDPNAVDIAAVHALLRTSYWAAERTAEIIEASIDRSLCFSLLADDRLVGFARVVTDAVTFSWFCDFIIDPAHRSNGLGKWILDVALEHPEVRRTRVCLGTRDAHELYRRYGFQQVELMRRPGPEKGTG